MPAWVDTAREEAAWRRAKRHPPPKNWRGSKWAWVTYLAKRILGTKKRKRNRSKWLG